MAAAASAGRRAGSTHTRYTSDVRNIIRSAYDADD